MSTYALVLGAALRWGEKTAAVTADPVFMTGIVVIVVVFSLAVVALTAISPNGGVAKESLKTLAALIRSLMS